MAQNAHLGKTHNVRSEKVGDGVISEVKFTKVCFKGKITAKFKAQAKMSNNFWTVQDRRKFPTDHLYKTNAAESIGDIRICLWHHLAAKTFLTETIFQTLQ